MRLLPLLLPALPLFAVVSADAPSTHYTTVTKTVYTGSSVTSATPTQESVGGGAAGRTITSVEAVGGGAGSSGVGRTITSVEAVGGGAGSSGVGRTITSVEAVGGGAGSPGVGRTITSVEQGGGGGANNGVAQRTKTVTVTSPYAAAAAVTPAARWQGAAAGVAVGILGLL